MIFLFTEKVTEHHVQHNSPSITSWQPDDNNNQSSSSGTETLSTTENITTTSSEISIDSYQHDLKNTPLHNTANNDSSLDKSSDDFKETKMDNDTLNHTQNIRDLFINSNTNSSKEAVDVTDLQKMSAKMQNSNANHKEYEEIIKKLNNTRKILIIKIGLIEQKLSNFLNATNGLDSSIEYSASKLQNVDESLLKLNTSWQNVDENLRKLDSKMQNFIKLFNDTKKGKSY